jgi:hypothetical protein
VSAYNALALHAEKQEYKKAYAGLSSGTQEILERRAKLLAEKSGGAVTGNAAELFFSANLQFASASQLLPADQVQILTTDGQKAQLRVTSRRGAQDLTMVREGSSWKLDLTEALHD